MIRTLHCSANIRNYNLCLDNNVVGFTHRGPETGDIVYLLFKEGKKSMCGARFELDQISDEKPWDDADKYVLCYSIKNVEFSNFFDMSFLKDVGGAYWPLKYLQGSKGFDDKAAHKLDVMFTQNISELRKYPVEQEILEEDDD